MNSIQALANAIVAQAAKDYRQSVRILKRRSTNRSAKAHALEIEQFFHSSWYQTLTKMDPDYLIKALWKENAS